MVHFDAKLTGTVEDVSLADLLQLFHYARKSATLHVAGGHAGRVVLVNGEIHHAECGPKVGEEALADLLAQKLVRVRTGGVELPSRDTVTRGFCAVLLDVLRKNDEAERDRREGAAPVSSPQARAATAFEPKLAAWLEDRDDVEHAAVIDPRAHMVLACDSPSLWGGLVQSLMIQTLVAPYFDDSFSEIDALLPQLPTAAGGEDRQTVVTFGGRRYVLGLVPERGWVAAQIFRAAQVNPGMSLTHMAAFRKAIVGWADDVLGPIEDDPVDQATAARR